MVRTWGMALLVVGASLAAAAWMLRPEPAGQGSDPAQQISMRRQSVFRSEPGPKGSLEAGPDVLFVTWDTVRADHVSLYGYPRRTTPFLEELSAESVVFDRFIVPMSTTLPSHVSMFTGTTPDEHGVLANVTISNVRFEPPESLKSIGSFLRDQGWYTAGFVSSSPLKHSTGIAEGFVHFAQPRGRDRIAGETVREASHWLKTAPADQPVFMWVHLVDPHWPWEPPPPTKGAMPSDSLLERHLRARDFGALSPHRTEQLLARLAAYDEEILYTDDQTRTLVNAWKEQRDWERTVVVVAGDHGEGLGEHDHLEHGLLWHEQLRSPLLMRVPGGMPRRVAKPTSGSDLLPTLLGLIDVPSEKTLLEQSSGQDVLDPSYEARPVFSRLSMRQVKRKKKTPSFSLTEKRWKLVADANNRRALYDLEADPHERKDVSADNVDVVERMSAQGEAMLQAQWIRAKRFGVGREREVSSQELRELKELGYVE